MMRQRVKITNLVWALGAVALAFYAQSLIRKPDKLNLALAWYGLAAIVFVVALARAPREKRVTILPAAREDAPELPAIGQTQRIAAWALVGVGLALMGAGLYLFRSLRPPGSAWTLYLASMVAFLAGAWLMDARLRRVHLSWRRLVTVQNVLLVLLIALAFFLRFYRIQQEPLGVWYDEADNGLWARMINQDPTYRPVYVESTNLPAHFLYLVAWSFRIFGEGILALRFVTAIFGTLTVLLTYLLVRDLFGVRMGFVAGLTMAVAHWDVNFSRLAMHGVSTPFFVLLVAYFLFRGLRTRRLGDWAAAGASLGMALCFYVPNRLYPFVIGIVLIYVMIRSRGFLKAFSPHLAMLVVGGIVAFGPVGLFIVQHPDTFFARTETTSVFKGKTRAEAVVAIKGNAVKHLLMFNYRGDGNGRHNLPGEPMLDFATSAFFVLGLAWSLYRSWKEPYYAFLVVGFVAFISGGVLSLDFEAPQSLRAIGTLPMSFLMAFAALGALWHEFDRTFSGRWQNYAWVAVAPLLLYVSYTNVNIYFVKQNNDFSVWNAYSTAETLMARRMVATGNDVDYRVISLYYQTPTVRFLAPDIGPYQRLETTDAMPLASPGTRETVMFIDPERKSLYDEVRRYYPAAEFEEVKPPFGGPVVLYICELTPSQVQGIQGLVGTYYSGEDWSGDILQQRQDAQISFDWSNGTPLPLPFSVEWKGTLLAPIYGNYRIGLRAPAGAELYIDETQVLTGAGEAQLPLAQGNHAVRLRVVGATGVVDLYWQPPGSAPEIISAQSLYTSPPVTNNGLLGRYYTNTQWAGQPTLMKVDPTLALYFHILLVPRPYTAEWEGKINIPQAGSYGFGLESIDDSWLYIDERLVVETHVGNQYRQGQMTLSSGLHDIRVRFLDQSNWSHINLYWVPPDQPREIIPADYLFPPQGSYPQLVEAARPSEVTPVTDYHQVDLVPVATWGQQGSGEGEFSEPRDIAVSDAGLVYVADTKNRRVQVFNLDGQFQMSLTGGDQPFVEPLAVVVNSKGELLVLDADTCWIYRFSAEGNYLNKFGGPDAQLYHPRGMAIDAKDNVYVADTGGGRFILFGPDGAKSGEYGTMGKTPGQLLEPTDVVIDPWGDLYTVDTGNQRIQNLDVFGRFKTDWPIPLANAYNGPHIVLADDGTLYVTAPELGTVQRYARDGSLIGQWGEGLLRVPVNLDLKDGRLYVTDTLNDRIQVFEIQELP